MMIQASSMKDTLPPITIWYNSEKKQERLTTIDHGQQTFQQLKTNKNLLAIALQMTKANRNKVAEKNDARAQ